jgi:hypothetical protein
MDAVYFPAWPLGVNEIAFLRHVGMFVDLANILNGFIIFAAIMLQSAIARYHEGMSFNYWTKGDHFPVCARGRGVDPNDV